MSCIVCDHTMHCIADMVSAERMIYICPRCGTLKTCNHDGITWDIPRWICDIVNELHYYAGTPMYSVINPRISSGELLRPLEERIRENP